MADKLVSSHRIKYGYRDKDGEAHTIWFEPGDEVKDIPQGVIERLLEIGSLSVPKSEPKPAPKPKVQAQPAAKVEPKPEPKVESEPKPEPKTKEQDG